MKNIAERLKELRTGLGLSQTDFGKKIGKNYHSVMRWELGKVMPHENVADLICSTFDVNKDWLLNGCGNMFKKSSATALEENESTKYISERYRQIPVYSNGVITGYTITDSIRGGLTAIKAPICASPPIFSGDVLIYRIPEEAENTNGKLCVIKDKYGSVTARWHYQEKKIMASRRPDYPDIPDSEIEVIGIIEEIQRKIPF